jgi:hypothetical protein
MLPHEEICLILVVSHGEDEPGERVLRLAEREAAQAGVELGPYLGVRTLGCGPLCHTYLGIRPQEG